MASSYAATDETTNHARMCRIYVELLRDVLWEVVKKEIPTNDLQNQISNFLQRVHPRPYRPVHHQLKELCQLPQDPHNTDCDISVLYAIIRNVCSLAAPARGWNVTPLPTAVDVADDVERIRLGRNKVTGHSHKASIPNATFQTEIQHIRNILSRLDKHVGVNFTAGLNTIVSDIMDPASHRIYQQYAIQLSEQARRDREMEAEIEKVKTEARKTRKKLKLTQRLGKGNQVKLERIQEEVREHKEKLDTTQEQLEEAQEKLEDTQKMVRENKDKLEDAEKRVEENRERTEAQIQDVTDNVENIQDRVTDVEIEVGEIKEKLSEVKMHSKSETDGFKQYLLGRYQEELSKVKVSRWCKAVNALELYKPLVIREDIEELLSSSKAKVDPLSMLEEVTARLSQDNVDIRNTLSRNGARSKRQIKCYSEIFFKDQQFQRRIFLLGEAGVGKTTFCHQLINLWVKLQTSAPSTNYEHVLSDIELVFHVQCRHAQQSQSVLEMIYNQRCPLKYRKVVESMFTDCPEKCLVIVDGLDEWTTKATHSLPDSTHIHGCTVLMTSRPWKIESLDCDLSPSCRVVEIEGLSQDNVESLSLEILKALNVETVHMAYGKFHKQICAKEMTEVIKIPLMLVIILISWHNGNQTLKNTLCMNYADLLESIIMHSEKKMQQSVNFHSIKQLPSSFDTLPCCLKYSSVIEKLAELAFNTLVDRSKETSLVFSKKDLVAQIGENRFQTSLDLGILSESSAVSESQECMVSISFLHKSIQEFLAAVHFSGEKFKECLDVFLGYLSSTDDVFDSKHMVLFLCGLAPHKAPLVVYHMAEVAGRSHRSVLIAKDDDSFCSAQRVIQQFERFISQCSYESDHVEDVSPDGGVVNEHQTSVFTGQSSHKVEQRRRFIIPDILIDRDTTEDEIKQFCSQEKQLLKSISFLDGAQTPMYVIKSLTDMTQLEKLCICLTKHEKNDIIQSLCLSISDCTQLKTFSCHVSDYSRTETGLSELLLKAVCTTPNLLSLHLNYLNLSAVNLALFPPHLSLLSLEWTLISSQVLARLPSTLTCLRLRWVTLPESASQLLLQFLSSSSALKTLELKYLYPYEAISFTPLTLPSLLDLSSQHQLHTLKLMSLILSSGVKFLTSQLKYVYLFRVRMPHSCWRRFIQSLPRTSEQLTVKLEDVNIDERILTYIAREYKISSLKGRTIEFRAKT